MPSDGSAAPEPSAASLAGYWRVVKIEGFDAWLRVRCSAASAPRVFSHVVALPLFFFQPAFHQPFF
jgi:hypothetical protein